MHEVRSIYLESLLIHAEHCRQQDNPNTHTTTLIFRVCVRSEGELYKYLSCTDFLENATNVFPINQECV